MRSICAKADLDLDQVNPAVLARMEILAETTETLTDCERCVDLAEDVFCYYDQEKPLERFSEVERRTVVIGTLFSDIGKTGPAEANTHGQQLVAEMFAVEVPLDGTTRVAQFFNDCFPLDASERALRFHALGLDPQMSLREFWNMHSAWTLRILRGDGVPKEAVCAAATHHLLENVNPDAIVSEDGRLDRYLGEHARFDRPEKLVILLDKYDAARRRGHKPHREAIRWLRKLIEGHTRFRDDAGFFSLIDALQEVGPSRDRGQSTCQADGLRSVRPKDGLNRDAARRLLLAYGASKTTRLRF